MSVKRLQCPVSIHVKKFVKETHCTGSKTKVLNQEPRQKTFIT